MAKLTSHTLNGVDGSHAENITVRLVDSGSGTVLLQSKTDNGGRLAATIEPNAINPAADYDLIIEAGDYWSKHGIDGASVIRQIVLRFSMPDVEGHYHMPVILSPYSYSTWKSA